MKDETETANEKCYTLWLICNYKSEAENCKDIKQN